MIDLLIRIGVVVIAFELLSIAVLCIACAIHWRDPINRCWRERGVPHLRRVA